MPYCAGSLFATMNEVSVFFESSSENGTNGRSITKDSVSSPGRRSIMYTGSMRTSLARTGVVPTTGPLVTSAGVPLTDEPGSWATDQLEVRS